MRRAAAVGFLAGVVTAALLLTFAVLRELSQTEARRVVPQPYDLTDWRPCICPDSAGAHPNCPHHYGDPTDEAGA